MEVRYTRCFTNDLKQLEGPLRDRIYEFVFEKYQRIDRIWDLPGLRQIDRDGIFYRCTVHNCIIGLEVTGNIIRFLRVLPTPDI
jgi:hypothetical protein